MPRSLKGGRLTFCLLVFAAVDPLVTGLAYRMLAMAADSLIWQRHLVVVPVVVSAMIFAIIPGIQRLLARPSSDARSRRRSGGD